MQLKLKDLFVHVGVAVLFCCGSATFAQSPSLTLSSASALPGGSVVLGLSLTSSPTAPAGLQWVLNYSTTDIVALSVDIGAASTAAGKSLSCAGTPGAYSCLAMGMNTNTIAPGSIAVVTVTLAPTALSTAISVTGSLGATATGDPLPVTGSGGVITVTQPAVTVSSVACTPSSLGSNASSSCAVTLSKTVPSGGITLNVSSDNGGLTVPATISVGSGSSASFNATTGTVAADGTANVTASYNGSSAKASIGLIAPVTVSSVACTPSSLGSNASSSCAVTLSKAVPSGGITLNISSNNGALTVPATVSVGSGSSASFNASTGSVAADGTANVTASYNGSSAKASIGLVAPVTVSSVACTPSSLGSNAISSCAVTLSKTVPSGGITLNISSDNGGLSVPATVSVGSGSSASFNATTGSVAADGTANVTASYNGSSAKASIGLVAPVTVSSVACTPSSLGSNAGSSCTVTFSKVVPSGGITLNVSSDNGGLSVPATVSVGSGSSVSFNATTGSVAADGTANVTASYNGSSAKASIGLVSSLTVSSVACTPSSLGSNGSSSCTVTLSKVVPSGGITLNVSSDNGALTVPATISVGSGSSASFIATTGTVTADGTANVTASYNGTSAKTGVGLVAPVTVSSLACTPSSLGSNASSSCAVTLSKAVPSGGITLNISSDNGLLTVPATVSVGSGSSASFNATTGTVAADGTANVTASYNGSSAKASISLGVPVTVSSVACAPSTLGSKAKSSCTVNLSKAVPAGGITLSVSDDQAALSVPPSLTVTSGSSASFGVSTGNLKTNAIATVTVNYNASYASTSVTLTGSGPGRHSIVSQTLSSLTCDATTLAGGGSTRCTVALSKDADDITVSLLSFGDALSYPDSVMVSAGSRTASFDVNVQPSAKTGVVVLTATYAGASRSVPLDISSSASLSSLACTPLSVQPGGTINCVATIGSNLHPGAELFVQVAADHRAVHVPSVLKTQSGRVTLPFQCSLDQSATGDFATITATAGINSVQQTIRLISATTPLLTLPSRQYARFGKLLQFTVFATDVEQSPLTIKVSEAPDGATFDPVSGRFEWVPQVRHKGRHTVQFTAINSAGVTSSASVEIRVDDGQPIIDTVINAASHSTTNVCSPGSIATLRGRWLSQDTADDPSGGTIELAGTTVKVNGEPAPLLHASVNQLDFVCPAVAPGTTLVVSAQNELGVTQPVAITMSDAAPGLFSLDGSGGGQGLVMLAGTPDLAIGRNPRVGGQPAEPDHIISVYATGLRPDANPIVKVDGAVAEVVAVKQVQDHEGVWEIQARVPPSIATSDHAALVIQVIGSDGTTLQSNEVKFAVEGLPVNPL